MLGIQWLTTLGDMQLNFKEKRMSFTWNGEVITLKGIDEQGELKLIIAKTLSKYLHKCPNATVGQLNWTIGIEYKLKCPDAYSLLVTEFAEVF